MFDTSDSQLIIRFVPEYAQIEADRERLAHVIPGTHLGNVVAQTNELMRSAWDYALSHAADERFREVRRLEATGAIKRQDIELAVVSVHEGSLEIILEWLVIIVGSSLLREIALGVGTNALWDLTKYSFQALRDLLRREKDSPSPEDPMVNELFSSYAQLARVAFTLLPEQGYIRTEFNYSGPEQEVSFTIDQHAQDRILELYRIETQSIMRLIGAVVGIDYSQEVVGVRFEHFPEETIWCDISGFDLREIVKYLPTSPEERPKRVGFDAEVAWMRGAAKVFPPSSIRIVRIVPEEELLNFSYAKPFERPPVYQMDRDLRPEEIKFLKWFSWADIHWHDPNVAGISAYLEKEPHVIGKRLSRREIEDLIKRFLEYGILYRAHFTRKYDPNRQALRLNRNHPVVIKYLGRT